MKLNIHYSHKSEVLMECEPFNFGQFQNANHGGVTAVAACSQLVRPVNDSWAFGFGRQQARRLCSIGFKVSFWSCW